LPNEGIGRPLFRKVGEGQANRPTTVPLADPVLPYGLPSKSTYAAGWDATFPMFAAVHSFVRVLRKDAINVPIAVMRAAIARTQLVFNAGPSLDFPGCVGLGVIG
jgi:hypothetical protein